MGDQQCLFDLSNLVPFFVFFLQRKHLILILQKKPCTIIDKPSYRQVRRNFVGINHQVKRMDGIPWHFIIFLGENHVNFIVLFHKNLGLFQWDLQFFHYAFDPHWDGGLQTHMQNIGKRRQYLKTTSAEDNRIAMLRHSPNGPIEHVNHFIPAL